MSVLSTRWSDNSNLKKYYIIYDFRKFSDQHCIFAKDNKHTEVKHGLYIYIKECTKNPKYRDFVKSNILLISPCIYSSYHSLFPFPFAKRGHVTHRPAVQQPDPYVAGRVDPSCWLSVKHLQRNVQPGRPCLLPLWSGEQQLLLHTAALCSRLLTTLCPTAPGKYPAQKAEGEEEGKYEGYGGVEELKEKNKTNKKKLPVFSSTKTSTSSDNSSGGFSWPWYSSEASPSWRFTLLFKRYDSYCSHQPGWKGWTGAKPAPGINTPEWETVL